MLAPPYSAGVNWESYTLKNVSLVASCYKLPDDAQQALNAQYSGDGVRIGFRSFDSVNQAMTSTAGDGTYTFLPHKRSVQKILLGMRKTKDITKSDVDNFRRTTANVSRVQVSCGDVQIPDKALDLRLNPSLAMRYLDEAFHSTDTGLICHMNYHGCVSPDGRYVKPSLEWDPTLNGGAGGYKDPETNPEAGSTFLLGFDTATFSDRVSGLDCSQKPVTVSFSGSGLQDPKGDTGASTLTAVFEYDGTIIWSQDAGVRVEV